MKFCFDQNVVLFPRHLLLTFCSFIFGCSGRCPPSSQGPGVWPLPSLPRQGAPHRGGGGMEGGRGTHCFSAHVSPVRRPPPPFLALFTPTTPIFFFLEVFKHPTFQTKMEEKRTRLAWWPPTRLSAALGGDALGGLWGPHPREGAGGILSEEAPVLSATPLPSPFPSGRITLGRQPQMP